MVIFTTSQEHVYFSFSWSTSWTDVSCSILIPQQWPLWIWPCHACFPLSVFRWLLFRLLRLSSVKSRTKNSTVTPGSLSLTTQAEREMSVSTAESTAALPLLSHPNNTCNIVNINSHTQSPYHFLSYQQWHWCLLCWKKSSTCFIFILI